MNSVHWSALPLSGRVLIEASAGTGKTWQIALLYLRLLLERGAGIEQILVCTFTDAAAAELRGRIRTRLAETERLLAPDCPPDSGELGSWLEQLAPDAEARQRCWQRVRLARLDFDRAPILTIHGFCARVLRELPFASGGSFAQLELLDESTLIDECFADFRRRVLQAPVELRPRWASLLLEPQPIRRAIDELHNNPGARRLQPDPHSGAELEDPLAALAPDQRKILEQLAGGKALHGNRVFTKRLRALLKGESLTQERVAELTPENLSKAAQMPLPEAWKPALARLFELAELAVQLPRIHRGQALAAASDWCQTELDRRCLERQALSFSTLISRVHLALQAPDGQLAGALAEVHPHLLIDEFQDTDQRQYGIFERLHRASPQGSLHLIGDPKQAIYAFRGGDIAAYTRAASQASVARFSISTNFRSSAALIEALNVFYGASSGGFADPQIRYQPVQCGGALAEKPYCIAGLPVSLGLSLQVDTGPEDSVGEIDKRALAACADQIAALLGSGAHSIGDQPVQPGDLAVLLHSNYQVQSMRDQLLQRGVPCIGAGRASVLQTEVANELELLMHALLHPGDDAALRGALSTELLGFDVPALRALDQDRAAWEAQSWRFDQWQRRWSAAGILALVENLLEERAGALLQLPQGERRLTDLRHLGELLLEHSVDCYGPAELLGRFRRLRHSEAAYSEDPQLRLESDARRVQLLTLHGSKGLQFPLVFLPLLWRPRYVRGEAVLARFHDAAGQLCFDLGSPDFERHLELHHGAAQAEQLRLLYVGLTRAQHAVYLQFSDRWRAWGDNYAPGPLSVLLDDIAATAGVQGAAAALSGLAALKSPIRIEYGFSTRSERWRQPEENHAPLAARSELPTPRPAFLIHSFSALTQRGGDLGIDAHGARDEALAELAEPRTDELPAAPSPGPPHPDLLQLKDLRGPRFGNAAHAVLELTPVLDAASGTRPGQPPALLQSRLVAQQLRAQGFAIADDSDPRVQALGLMLERVRQADLGAGKTLAGLSESAQVREFEFHFAVHGVHTAELRRTAIRHGYPELVPADLRQGQLRGLMSGFIDLVCCWDDVYYLIDYKSNWLGESLSDYAPEALKLAVGSAHYDLQALIYSVALHRYLRQRLPDYDYAVHAGGVMLLFLRAVGLHSEAGIHRERFPVALIDAIDAAFAGAALVHS